MFIGLDLAWGARNPTGVAVVDDGGELVHVGVAGDDESILAQLRPFSAGDCVVGIDAPLVVTNPAGNRACEAELNRDFRAYQAGAHPSNTGRPWFADGTRGGRLAAALELDMDPRSGSVRRALEVYPHAATVALFHLDRTLKYKHKPGRDVAELRAELTRMMDLVEGLATAAPALHVAAHPGWATMRTTVSAAARKSVLRRAEDPVDAVVCAYVALYFQRRPADVTIYGDPTAGCIVTPTLAPRLGSC